MALERFRQLGDLNDSFVASLSTQQRGSALRGSGSLYHGGGGDDEELLFNMSEIDMD